MINSIRSYPLTPEQELELMNLHEMCQDEIDREEVNRILEAEES